jgi:predicted RNA-binding protein associated with RNAse of E/G family
MARVKIHYRRPPDRITVYENELVFADAAVTVTMMRATQLARPMIVNERVVFENGAPAIWFTFPDADHDIGRFHTTAGVFTGIYANVLTPVEFVSPTEWRTTDLFLDVWADANGTAQVLDENELTDATARGWLDAETAARARATAGRIVRAYEDGTWPPPVVYDWPLERILEMKL